MKDVTDAELSWLIRLEKLLRNQPKDISLLSRFGKLVVTRPDVVEDCFDQNGDIHNVDELMIIETRIEPSGEAL